MAGDTYLFIDGEYLRQRHRQAMQDFFGVEGELELSPLMEQSRARRVYFYDCIDEALLPSETEESRRYRIAPLEAFLSRVQALSGFHVRPGTVRRGKKREQKEIDVSLSCR